MSLLAAAAFPRWQPHLEVWLLVAGVVALGVYAVRVIGPKVVPEGEPVVSRRQVVAFVGAVAVLWIASDWPIHDISEQRLYSVHMLQHLLFTLVMAPLFLIACPEWLARLVVRTDGPVYPWIRRIARPVPALVVYVGLVLVTHWSVFVNTSVENGAFHYAAHVVVVGVALLMWMPVCSPWPEMRIAVPGQMIYLFVVSIIPTIPGAWLTLAHGVVYGAYDQPVRLWGITAIEDQQYAGLLMKLAGGIYLWAIITFLFFSWAARQGHLEEKPIVMSAKDSLTFDEVEREFRRIGEPRVAEEPAEPRK